MIYAACFSFAVNQWFVSVSHIHFGPSFMKQRICSVADRSLAWSLVLTGGFVLGFAAQAAESPPPPAPSIVMTNVLTLEGAIRTSAVRTSRRCERNSARIESLGGEGLMLRQPGSKYVAGRSTTLLKVKTFHDAEAVVLGHQAGAGRHKGRLGALLVRLPDGTEFAIGTGFSDRERENPPAVGATVTFRYQELSEAGVPRFPSWVGVRLDAAIKPSQPIADASGPKPPTAPATIIASSTSGNKPRYFEFVQGTSSKFWEVSQAGNAMTTRWGRIGSNGQSKTKTFADEDLAANAVTELIEEKTAEGYIERQG